MGQTTAAAAGSKGAATASAATAATTAATTSAPATPATPETVTANVGIANVFDLTLGWTMRRTGTDTFKVEHTGEGPSTFYAADIVQLVSVKALNQVSAVRSGALVTRKPTSNDLDVLSGPPPR